MHCLSGNCLIPFLLNCNVETENIYTLHFIPGTGIPDSFGMQQDYLNTYISGKMYEVDPSGNYSFNMDLVFATFVKSKINGLNDEMIDRSSVFKIIGSSV